MIKSDCSKLPHDLVSVLQCVSDGRNDLNIEACSGGFFQRSNGVAPFGHGCLRLPGVTLE